VSLITSLKNSRIKDAVCLRERRGREQQGRMIVDGARPLQRALEAGVELDVIFFCQELAVSVEATQVLAIAPTELLRVSESVFDRLAFGNMSDGLVGIARPPHAVLDQIRLSQRPLIVVLEGIEKPGNMGAVIRSADATGVEAVMIANGGTDIYNPNAIRASQGAIFTLPVVLAESNDLLKWLQAHNVIIFAACIDGEATYTECSFTQGTAFVLGSEARGLTDRWRVDPVVSIRLPMHGVSDSLNVSTTAAVLLYEAVRQRSESSKSSQ